jgi:hypothetical protein
MELLAGEGAIRDHAIGERVDIVIGESSQVRVAIQSYATPGTDRHSYRATVSNANPYAVTFELGFDYHEDGQLDSRLRKLPRKDGLPTWTVRVPANATRRFDYRVRASGG